MSNPQDEREAFEAWARGYGYQRDELDRCRTGIVGPAYYNANTETTWQAWQARAALANQRAEAQRGEPTVVVGRNLREIANYLRASDISDGIKAEWLSALSAAQPEAVPQGGQCPDDKAIAQAMLAVDDPLQWGRLGEGSKPMIKQFVEALFAAAPPSPQPPAARAQPIGYISPDRLDAMKRGECDTIPLICEAGAELTGALGRADVPVYLEPPASQAQCKGDPEECAFNGACMYDCKSVQTLGAKAVDELLEQWSDAAGVGWCEGTSDHPETDGPVRLSDLRQLVHAAHGIGTAKPAQPDGGEA